MDHLIFNSKTQTQSNKQWMSSYLFAPRYQYPSVYLVKKFYQSCLKEEEIDFKQQKGILKEFGGWPVVVDSSWNESSFKWTEMIYKFRHVDYPIDFFIDFSIAADWKNSTARVIYVFTKNAYNLIGLSKFKY